MYLTYEYCDHAIELNTVKQNCLMQENCTDRYKYQVISRFFGVNNTTSEIPGLDHELDNNIISLGLISCFEKVAPIEKFVHQ